MKKGCWIEDDLLILYILDQDNEEYQRLLEGICERQVD